MAAGAAAAEVAAASVVAVVAGLLAAEGAVASVVAAAAGLASGLGSVAAGSLVAQVARVAAHPGERAACAKSKDLTAGKWQLELGNVPKFGEFTGSESNALEDLDMRASIFAIVVVAGSAIGFPATAQQQAAPSEQTKEQMHSDVDKGLKISEPNEQMQRDADKGIKTRNSGESGYVTDQDKPGASAHPPGRPESEQTTGSTSTPK
jgi:hypothetical protein